MSRLWEFYERQEARWKMAKALLGGPLPEPRKRYMQKSTPLERFRTDKGLLVLDEDAIGLRWVGNVMPELGGRGYSHYLWAPDGEPTGWFTNLDGWTTKSGDGLVWGVVLQFPARKGVSSFVGGWQEGAWDRMVTIDLKTVFTEEKGYDPRDVADLDACRDAARHADGMAERVSDDCREAEQEIRDEEDQAEAKAKAEALENEE